MLVALLLWHLFFFFCSYDARPWFYRRSQFFLLRLHFLLLLSGGTRVDVECVASCGEPGACLYLMSFVCCSFARHEHARVNSIKHNTTQDKVKQCVFCGKTMSLRLARVCGSRSENADDAHAQWWVQTKQFPTRSAATMDHDMHKAAMDQRRGVARATSRSDDLHELKKWVFSRFNLLPTVTFTSNCSSVYAPRSRKLVFCAWISRMILSAKW